MKYVKKPIPVEATRIPVSDEFAEWLVGAPKWFKEAFQIGKIFLHPSGLIIATLEGEMLCEWGNYLIRGIKGELYPCRRDIFEETYEVYND